MRKKGNGRVERNGKKCLPTALRLQCNTDIADSSSSKSNLELKAQSIQAQTSIGHGLMGMELKRMENRKSFCVPR
jgi:hypothetical protein